MKIAFLTLTLLLLFSILFAFQSVFAAVGCTLNNPDQDIKRLFPEVTSYKTEYIQIDKSGGKSLYERVQRLLGDKFDGIYETIDVPYAFYLVFKGNQLIGYVHGINQAGKYGLMQVILATDTSGNILDWYYQRISSPEAAVLKSSEFKSQFIGLTLADFYKHEYLKTQEKFKDQDKVGQLKDLTKNSRQEFFNTLRAMKKNLILLDQYWYGRKFEVFWNEAQNLLNK